VQCWYRLSNQPGEGSQDLKSQERFSMDVISLSCSERLKRLARLLRGPWRLRDSDVSRVSAAVNLRSRLRLSIVKERFRVEHVLRSRTVSGGILETVGVGSVTCAGNGEGTCASHC